MKLFLQPRLTLADSRPRLPAIVSSCSMSVSGYVDLAARRASMLPIVEMAAKPVHIREPFYLYKPSGLGNNTGRTTRKETTCRSVSTGALQAGVAGWSASRTDCSGAVMRRQRTPDTAGAPPMVRCVSRGPGIGAEQAGNSPITGTANLARCRDIWYVAVILPTRPDIPAECTRCGLSSTSDTFRAGIA